MLMIFDEMKYSAEKKLTYVVCGVTIAYLGWGIIKGQCVPETNETSAYNSPMISPIREKTRRVDMCKKRLMSMEELMGIERERWEEKSWEHSRHEASEEIDWKLFNGELGKKDKK